jgi:hypothetical protein
MGRDLGCHAVRRLRPALRFPVAATEIPKRSAAFADPLALSFMSSPVRTAARRPALSVRTAGAVTASVVTAVGVAATARASNFSGKNCPADSVRRSTLVRLMADTDEMARLHDVVVDCTQPASLARFWAAVLDGYAVAPYVEDEIAGLRSMGIDDVLRRVGLIRSVQVPAIPDHPDGAAALQADLELEERQLGATGIGWPRRPSWGCPMSPSRCARC